MMLYAFDEGLGLLMVGCTGVILPLHTALFGINYSHNGATSVQSICQRRKRLPMVLRRWKVFV
jgi:hypothetical protein